MPTLEMNPTMDIIVRFPDNLGKEISQMPDHNDLIVHATQKALQERWLNDQTAKSLKQADNGEYADEAEVKRFLDKWSDYES